MNGFGWTPVIEPEHDTAFITQYQYEAIALGHMSSVPLILGINSEELLSKARSTYNYHQFYLSLY